MLDPSEAGTMHVYTAIEDGTPLPGVMLTIMNLASQLERVTLTNAEGAAGFRAIPPGAYQLRAEHDGFETVEYPHVDVQPAHVTTVEIEMTPTMAT